MIKVTRFQGKEYYVNSDLIETIEETPDTIIGLVTGKKFLVMEKPEELIAQIIKFRNSVNGQVRIVHIQKEFEEV